MLTPKLYKACRNDAESLCAANRDWHVTKGQRPMQGDDRVFVFPCLVRHLDVKDDGDDADDDQEYQDDGGALTPECQDQVRCLLVSTLHDLQGRLFLYALHAIYVLRTSGKLSFCLFGTEFSVILKVPSRTISEIVFFEQFLVKIFINSRFWN